jgi:predicted RNA-binding Zn ribbon-like protein
MATERLGARTAPAGLALVQELVNTHAVERGDSGDLLDDGPAAQRWLAGAIGEWARVRGLDAPRIARSAEDLRAVRDLRTAVQELITSSPGQQEAGSSGDPGTRTARSPAVLLCDQQGKVTLAPSGSGVGWLASAVWSEILLAQLSGDWARVKLCREPGCRSAFYDTSRNVSGVWHDVRSCGNIANLRASRTRRKIADQAKQASA